MTLHLSSELATALIESARRLGVDPETLAIRVLRERFLADASTVNPCDEWEARLLTAATDCGVSVPNSALSSDELYN